MIVSRRAPNHGRITCSCESCSSTLNSSQLTKPSPAITGSVWCLWQSLWHLVATNNRLSCMLHEWSWMHPFGHCGNPSWWAKNSRSIKKIHYISPDFHLGAAGICIYIYICVYYICVCVSLYIYLSMCKVTKRHRWSTLGAQVEACAGLMFRRIFCTAWSI